MPAIYGTISAPAHVFSSAARQAFFLFSASASSNIFRDPIFHNSKTLIELKLNVSVVCCPLSVANLTRFIRRYDNALAEDLSIKTLIPLN